CLISLRDLVSRLHVPLRALSANELGERWKPVLRLGDGCAENFDAAEVTAANTQLLGEAEGAVSGLEGRRAAVGHVVGSHDGGGDGIERYAVHARDDQTRMNG